MRINRIAILAAVSLSLTMAAVGQSPRVDINGKRPSIHTFEAEISKKTKLDYLVYLPSGYEASEKQWPLLFWLHGDGAQPLRGGLEELRSYGPPKMAEETAGSILL